MSARDNILARIRRLQGRTGSCTETELQAIREDMARHRIGARPSMPWTDLPRRFSEQCERLATTHDQVDTLDAVPAAVARYLQSHALSLRLAGWPEFVGLNWRNAGITYDNRPANGEDATGLTGCFCSIAETGTLLLLGAAATPKVTALLPETHIAVVRKERIVRTMEDAFALMRSEIGAPPRSTFFVSGPSRTADIEQTIVIGAHGPYRVHVILV
jgi:L-lactate dehydrogenase complex protein LldG